MGPRCTLVSNQGCQCPWGLAQGLKRRHCFPCGIQERFSVVRCFFLLWCHQCLVSPPSKVTIPSGAICLLWGTPSRPETHPGFEPGRPRSPGPIAGAEGKTLSSVRDKEGLSVVLFFYSTGNQPPHNQTLPYLPLSGLRPTFRYHYRVRNTACIRTRDSSVPRAQCQG